MDQDDEVLGVDGTGLPLVYSRSSRKCGSFGATGPRRVHDEVLELFTDSDLRLSTDRLEDSRDESGDLSGCLRITM